jgi:hypothetical protein
MRRPAKQPPPSPAAPRWVQLDMFPRPVVVEPLDPRAVGGPRTRVLSVHLVREHAGAPAHRVFADRHGWYCEEHGARCPLVGALRRSLESGSAAGQA